jgi:hypothetical protein
VDRSDLPVGDPRYGNVGGDRLMTYTDQGQRTLGRRRLVATTRAAVYAAVCDDRRCDLQRRPTEGDGSWVPIVARPRQIEQVTISGDDSWLLSLGTHLAVYAVDGVGVTLVHTGALDALFSADSLRLYVITGHDLEVVDLVGDERRTVALTAQARSGADWEVVAPAGPGEPPRTP